MVGIGSVKSRSTRTKRQHRNRRGAADGDRSFPRGVGQGYGFCKANGRTAGALIVCQRRRAAGSLGTDRQQRKRLAIVGKTPERAALSHSHIQMMGKKTSDISGLNPDHIGRPHVASGLEPRREFDDADFGPAQGGRADTVGEGEIGNRGQRRIVSQPESGGQILVELDPFRCRFLTEILYGTWCSAVIARLGSHLERHSGSHELGPGGIRRCRIADRSAVGNAGDHKRSRSNNQRAAAAHGGSGSIANAERQLSDVGIFDADPCRRGAIKRHGDRRRDRRTGWRGGGEIDRAGPRILAQLQHTRCVRRRTRVGIAEPELQILRRAGVAAAAGLDEDVARIIASHL